MAVLSTIGGLLYKVFFVNLRTLLKIHNTLRRTHFLSFHLFLFISLAIEMTFIFFLFIQVIPEIS